jgi:hypothetical protein
VASSATIESDAASGHIGAITMTGQARILLLCDDRRGSANTVLDHINAFVHFSRHQVRTFNPKAMRQSVALDLDAFDVVVVHYSVEVSDPTYVSERILDKLRRFRGLKIQFIQDDYRWVNRATAAARDVGIGVLFTVAPDRAAAQLYDERLPGVRRVHTLTGYVPDNLMNRPVRALHERSIDVGYRARDLPFWLGRLAREKAWIGQRFLELAPAYGLRCDIAWSEHDRIYGEQWIGFVESGRATLGTESGASIADYDGSIELAVRNYLREHPGAPFEEVHAAVLDPYEGNVVVSAISPRVFEAASLRTALVMFPGEYSGVISAGDHYIRLEKDFSNIDEVVANLHDDAAIASMTSRTYDDLIKSGRWSYDTFLRGFDAVVDEEAKVMRGPSAALRWRLARAERSLRVPSMRVRLFRAAHTAWSSIFGRDRSMRFELEYESQVEKGLLALRTALRDPELRPLFRSGRRTGAPLDRLLREILELSLLRRASIGGSLPDQAFSLNREFDPVSKSLRFVSTPPGHEAVSSERITELREAVHAGQLKAMVWDHRALGGTIRLDRPAMLVGIGSDGLESFSVLTEIGHLNPAALERALAPLLPDEKPALSAVD